MRMILSLMSIATLMIGGPIGILLAFTSKDEETRQVGLVLTVAALFAMLILFDLDREKKA